MSITITAGTGPATGTQLAHMGTACRLSISSRRYSDMLMRDGIPRGKKGRELSASDMTRMR